MQTDNKAMTFVTQELIEAGASKCGGWNRAQLEIIGVKWPPMRGWRKRAEGREISVGEAETFVALRGVTKKLKRKSVGHLSDLLLKHDAEA